MPNADKWLEDYKKSRLMDASYSPPKEKAAIKRHVRKVEQLWHLLPSDHRNTVIKMCAQHLHEGASNPYC
jgi:hypothetical protein